MVELCLPAYGAWCQASDRCTGLARLCGAPWRTCGGGPGHQGGCGGLGRSRLVQLHQHLVARKASQTPVRRVREAIKV